MDSACVTAEKNVGVKKRELPVGRVFSVPMSQDKSLCEIRIVKGKPRRRRVRSGVISRCVPGGTASTGDGACPCCRRMVTGSLTYRNCVREAVRDIGGVVTTVSIEKTDPSLAIGGAGLRIERILRLGIAPGSVETLRPAIASNVITKRKGRNRSVKVAVVNRKRFPPTI